MLPGELPASFAPEAQKALAVAARTYALRNLGKHAAEGADLCDGVHCQMYLGDTNASPPGRNAVRSTRGLCAWYQGELVCTFYSADCGGESTSAANVPLPDMPRRLPPYLRPVRDRPGPRSPDYCCASPSHWWSAQVSLARLQALLDASPQTWLGTLKSVAFTGRDLSGRVTRVRLTGAGPSLDPAVPVLPIVRTMSGWEFRRLAGPRRLRSTLMRIVANDGKMLRITGTGNGHGLGLCQIGANGMAKTHHTFRQILLHYYPGTDVAPIPLPAARAHGPAAG